MKGMPSTRICEKRERGEAASPRKVVASTRKGGPIYGSTQRAVTSKCRTDSQLRPLLGSNFENCLMSLDQRACNDASTAVQP
jgi:hypothetical protein